MPEAGLRPGRRGLGVFCLAMSLAIIGLFGDSLFGSKVLSQSDALQQFAPWSDEAPEAVASSPELLDQSIVMQPWQSFAAQRIGRGTAPLWNPNNYAGQPMVGTYQTAYFWPLNWIYYIWPSWTFLAWSAGLRLTLTGLFAFLFLRRLDLTVAAATTGALAFALSGFMIAWLGHMHTHVAMFLPALFWQIERTAHKPSRRGIGVFALLVAGALLAGHLQTAVHVAIGTAAYLGFRVWKPVCGSRVSLQALRGLCLGGVLGALVAMPQLLPFFDYLATSSGATVLEEMNSVDAVKTLDIAVLSVDPGHFGSPAAAQGYGPYTGPKGSNVNYNEVIGSYVGRVALLLALVGLFGLGRKRLGTSGQRSAVWFFGGFAVLSLCIAWQVWPVYDLALLVPKLKSTKLMRFALLAAFGIACLAAFGVQALQARIGKRVYAVMALVGLELVLFGRGYNPQIEASAIAPATAVTDFLRGHLPESGRPATWRALGVDNSTLMPSANLYYDIPMVSGYDSMETRTTTELVALMSSDPRADLFIKELQYFDRGFAVAHLLGVRFVMSAVELPAPFELRLDGPTKVYENMSALPRAFAADGARVIEDKAARLAALGSDGFDPRVAILERQPSWATGTAVELLAGSVEMLAYDDLEVTVAADFEAGDGRGLVVLADAWDAGWVCDLDGEAVAVERVDHGLRGVFVGPGPHELVFRYVPVALNRGLLLGAFGLLVILGLLVGTPKRDAAQ